MRNCVYNFKNGKSFIISYILLLYCTIYGYFRRHIHIENKEISRKCYIQLFDITLSSYKAVSESFQFDELSFSECEHLSKIFTAKIVLPTRFFLLKIDIYQELKYYTI